MASGTNTSLAATVVSVVYDALVAILSKPSARFSMYSVVLYVLSSFISGTSYHKPTGQPHAVMSVISNRILPSGGNETVHVAHGAMGHR